MRDSPELHWSTQAGTSSSVRDPYPARGLILHRRPLSGLPPHFRGERRIKQWGIAAGTATGAALGTKSNAKAERKCQKFALVTTLFRGRRARSLGGRPVTVPCLAGSVSPLNSLSCGLQRPSATLHGNAQGRTRFALSRALRACPGLCRAYGVDGYLSTWSAVPRCCTRGRPWSSSQGSHRVRNQTGGIPPRASCPAASRFPARFSRWPAGA